MPGLSTTKRLWSSYRRAAAERAAIRRLSHLSDDLLRDIGLDRDGIRAAVRSGRGR